jgi:hypothetical protein
MPGQLTAGAVLGAVEIAAAEVQPRARPSQGDAANDWLCAQCLHGVASEKDRLSSEGQGECSFTNPAGIRFEILLFSRAPGCQQAGLPTLEHTWFPGHAWSYCLCGRCGRHLGWYYTGPSEFAGLIRNRILRAAVVMN